MFAYMTVLTNSGYRGVEVLAKSLRLVDSKYDLFVLVPIGMKNLLSGFDTEKYHIRVKEVSNIELSEVDEQSYWKETIFKIKVFDAAEFEKIVFLDSDMVVLKNIDHLFDAPSLSAVPAGGVLHTDWANQLNSGLMVLEPNKRDYRGLCKLVLPTYKQRQEMGYDFGD